MLVGGGFTVTDDAGRIVLVTGAERNVGAEVVQQLRAQDVPVRAAIPTMEHAYGKQWHGAALATFRYDEPATYPAVFEGVNRLLLVMPPGDFESTEGEIAGLVDFAAGAGVEHIVFISAMGTENLHISMQWAVEQQLMCSGVAYTILRSGWFFQNFITNPQLVEDVRQGLIRVPFGNARVSMVDVRDVAAVAVAAFTEDGHRNQIYTLGEHLMDMHDIVMLLSKVLGRSIGVTMVSEHEIAHELRASGMPRQVAKWWRIVYQLMQQGAYTATIPDVSRVLGRPSITFKQFAQEHAAAWA